jgi:hypothetical protein
MQHLYFISPRRMTSLIMDAATADRVPVLNELLRPSAEHIQDRSGDLVHKDLDSAKRLAFDILVDLGDKRMDVLRIDVTDDVFFHLKSKGDLVDSARPDCFGAPMYWLSQQGCRIVNDFLAAVEPTHIIVDVSTAGVDVAPHTVN